jgi:hypothetical protein
MIKELSNRLSKQLEQDLEEVVFQVKDPLQRLTTALKLIRDALKKFRVYLAQYPFKSKADEIPIFKYTKPSFYQWQIYYTELYNIETGLPFGDTEKQVVYLEQELHYIERFFRQYAFLYQYYKVGADELDTLYFVRGGEAQSVLLPNVPDLDPEFSTSCDYLFSKFKAFEGLKEWVTERLLFLKVNPLTPYQPGSDPGEMNWTGDTINLAEVGIGFFNTGQVRNGTASLSEIFRWLEVKFQVSIGVPSKRLAELRRRKRLSRTKYLDEMKESIIHKLDKDDEHNPDKGKSR